MARQTVIRGGDDDDDDQRRNQAEGRKPPSSEPPAPGNLALNDQPYDEQLRPQRLADVVGQRKVVERLQILIDSELAQ